METRISVHLTGPAKIEGKWRKPGEEVEVTPDIARELEAACVVPKGADLAFSELASGLPGFDEAVAEQAKLLAEAVVAAAVEAAMLDLTADRDAARTRAADADAEVSRQHAQIMRLEAEIAELEAARDALTAEIETRKSSDTPSGGATSPADAPPVAASRNAHKRATEAKQG